MVQVYKDYYIDADPLQYTLERKKVRESGENAGSDYFIVIGYFTRLDFLFNRLLEQVGRDAIMDENTKTVKDVLMLMKEATDYIKSIFDDLRVKIDEDRTFREKSGDEEELLDV